MPDMRTWSLDSIKTVLETMYTIIQKIQNTVKIVFIIA